MNQKKFTRYAWFVLAFNVLVILWGAYVRATGSGAGCGSHWPLCNGQVVPRAPRLETLIELAHRLSSGLAGLLVVAMVVRAFRLYPKGHLARQAATLSFLFILSEGLLGASLVLFEWVAHNDSVARVISMAAHLNNTFLLLVWLTLTPWWAEGNRPVRFHGRWGWLLGGALLAMMVVSTAGAVTALGDTLFPAGTLAEGVARDFSPTAHFLERLRIWHPILAILLGIYLFGLGNYVIYSRPGGQTQQLARLIQGLVVTQITAGFVNILLLAPVWMQIIHLLLADTLWIMLVLLAASLLAVQPATDSPALPQNSQLPAIVSK